MPLAAVKASFIALSLYAFIQLYGGPKGASTQRRGGVGAALVDMVQSVAVH